MRAAQRTLIDGAAARAPPTANRTAYRRYQKKGWFMRHWQNKGDDAAFKDFFARLDRAAQDFELDLVVGSLAAR